MAVARLGSAARLHAIPIECGKGGGAEPALIGAAPTWPSWYRTAVTAAGVPDAGSVTTLLEVRWRLPR
jgi:hypothetical protein